MGVGVDYQMQSFKLSAVAAACILCYRKEAGKKPLWPDSLEAISGYALEEIKDLAAKLWSYIYI